LNHKVWKVLSNLDQKSRLERLGKINISEEKMMYSITWDTGLFFNTILKSMDATKVLEVGTSVGYSTLWFAEALRKTCVKRKNIDTQEGNGVLTIERDPFKAGQARKNFIDAGVQDMIDVKEGNAKRVLEDLLNVYRMRNHNKNTKHLFDFVFLDADKENLKNYFDLVLLLVRVGGIICADNILYPESTRSLMMEYLCHIKNKHNIQTVTVPIGSGEEVTIRLS
jgi:caffeoyl-CoA O-methyltransferase